MQVTAQLNQLRIAPRKVRLVAGLIKGMDVVRAQAHLSVLAKRSSASLSKLLKSAISNAENNASLNKENLFIKDIIVNEGTKLKRFRPKGMGRVNPIQKKTSRIKIVLEERVPGLKRKKRTVEKEKPVQPSVLGADKVKKEKPPEIKREIGQKRGMLGDIKNIGRKFFRRKTI